MRRGSGQHRRTLLIVDDDPLVLRVLARAHAAADALEVRTASSMDAALAEIDAGGVDILLFDVCLPTAEHGVRLVTAVLERAPLPTERPAAEPELHVVRHDEVKSYYERA